MKANSLNLEEESFLMALASFRIMTMKDVLNMRRTKDIIGMDSDTEKVS